MKKEYLIKGVKLLIPQKIWLKMKLITVFLFLVTFCLQANNTYSQNATVNLNLENVSLTDVFREIEKQSDYRFFFNSAVLSAVKKQNIKTGEKSITSVLDQLFEGTDIGYKLIDHYIVITSKKEDVSNLLARSDASIQIVGLVTDENGEPISGASVSLKGSTVGTITDIDGKYTISVPTTKSVLVFSFIGYVSQNIIVGSRSVINVKLKEDNQLIDEVVVIGYGSVRKSDLTGSVSQVRSTILENQAVLRDPVQGLQGKVAGLDITVGNKPGDTSTPIIRGYNSLNAGNDPLIVLDGAPFGGKISDINPAEIEAIDVLKDASSTAIYGSRGSNGVIIITTKRGKMDGKVSVSYDGFVGISKSFKDYNMMSGDKWANYLRAANPGKTDAELFVGVTDILESRNFVDWQEEMFSGTGFQTDNNVTVNVGKDNMSNLIVLGYNKNQSIIDNMSSERFSMRLNGDVRLFDRLKLGYSAMYSHRKTDNGNNSVFINGTTLNPVTRIYDDEGALQYYPSPYCESFMQINPKYYVSDEYLENQSFRDRAFFNFSAELDIIDGLSFRTSLTPDFQFIEDGNYNSPYMNLMSYNSLSYKKTTEKSLTFTNILKYDKQIGIHNLSVSAVHDMQTYTTDYLQLTGSDVPYYGKWYNVNEAPDIFERKSSYTKWSLLSFMGRINYTLKDKYLLTLTGRYDGSSRLAKGNKWDFFPSVALAWRINSESFMQNVDVISNLKMRLSWGNTGNTAIDSYSTLGAFSKYPYVMGIGEESAMGYLPKELSNPGLGWERTEEYNIGFDFGFFRNRIEGTVDLYRRDTHDLLMKRLLPITTGYNETWQNIGKTRNTGVEVALNTVPFVNKNWEWTVGLTFAYNKNEIVELYDGLTQDRDNKWFVGEPLQVELLYKYDGVWQMEEAEEAKKYGYVPGNPKVKDVNQNGKYDQEDQFIYNKIPKFTGGLNTTLKYKNLDLNLYLYSRIGYGQKIGLLTYEAGSSRMNHLDVDFWTQDNPSNTFPKPVGSNTQPLLEQSDYAYRNLSFLRLKNINLGYTFPAQMIEKIKANRLRVYLAVDNPFVWTFNNFEGLDPENCYAYDSHRPLTSFVFGLNVSF